MQHQTKQNTFSMNKKSPTKIKDFFWSALSFSEKYQSVFYSSIFNCNSKECFIYIINASVLTKHGRFDPEYA